MSFSFGLGIAVFVIAIVGDSVAAWKVEGEGIRVVQEFGHPFQLQNIKFITWAELVLRSAERSTRLVASATGAIERVFSDAA